MYMGRVSGFLFCLNRVLGQQILVSSPLRIQVFSPKFFQNLSLIGALLPRDSVQAKFPWVKKTLLRVELARTRVLQKIARTRPIPNLKSCSKN